MKIAVAAALLWPVVAVASPCEKYGDGTVSGTIHRVLFYGPPNFGEDPKTDGRGYYPVLTLDRTRNFCAGKDADAATAKRMQMVFFHPPFDKALYGKHVTVTGEMFPWETAWHHTPVMLTVKDIRVVP